MSHQNPDHALNRLIIRVPDQTWQAEAACADADHRLFLNTTYNAASRQALDHCRNCPVTSRCTRARGTADGIWGGRIYGINGPVLIPKPRPTVDPCDVCGSTATTGIPGCPGLPCKTRRAAYDQARYQARRSA